MELVNFSLPLVFMALWNAGKNAEFLFYAL